MLGVFSGKDIEIIEFHPPPMEFVFEKELKKVFWPWPRIEAGATFRASATLEFALVRNVPSLSHIHYVTATKY